MSDFHQLTLSKLDSIISNKSRYSEQEVALAQRLADEKRQQLKAKNFDLTQEIDSCIRQFSWLDFDVYRYDGYRLTVVGSTDFSYYHQLEIIFEDVFFVFGNFSTWGSDTEKRVFGFPDNEAELITRFNIEQDYQLFEFRQDGLDNDFIIASNTLTYNTDKVYYYPKDDLQPNERLADFVNKRKQN